MHHELVYERNSEPFGKSWEEWAALWCSWMLSIPKKENPSLDETGKYCSMNQFNENVWFLTGTFGNIIPVKRKCVVPSGKAIFFPVLVKEDSLAEDLDLKTDAELINRSSEATDRLIHMEASIDGKIVDNLEQYRVQSEVFELTFPESNVYGVRAGLTRSVCDGYWLFIKPLSLGRHKIYFKGETLLQEPYTLTQLKDREVYGNIWHHIDQNSTFKLEVWYELMITK
jgi:hypothetical protein